MSIAEGRVEKLCGGFVHYVEAFDKSERFTGPSVYFHRRTLNRLHGHGRLSEVFDDNLFLEYLYATLASWGLHRIGTLTILADFSDFVESLRSCKGLIQEAELLRLVELPEPEVIGAASHLWKIINAMKINKGETKLVANSKALHHFLPQLIPPIDRTYTLQFFFNSRNLYPRDEMTKFLQMYSWFAKIARRNSTEISTVISSNADHGFHTSEPKVIDNAIVGFVLEELKSKRVREHGSANA